MEGMTKNIEGKRFQDVKITGIPPVSKCAESSQNGL
jgi:hypothetical protein